MSKSFTFLVKSFWASFIDIWRFLSGHTAPNGICIAIQFKIFSVTQLVWLYLRPHINCHWVTLDLVFGAKLKVVAYSNFSGVGCPFPESRFPLSKIKIALTMMMLMKILSWFKFPEIIKIHCNFFLEETIFYFLEPNRCSGWAFPSLLWSLFQNNTHSQQINVKISI